MSTEQKIIGAIGLFTLLILVGGIFFLSGQDAKEQVKQSQKLLGQKMPDMGSIHVKQGETHGEYNSNPPTSGPHIGTGTAGAGIHATEVPDELLVHSLEHGAAIVSYKADLPKADIEKITKAFNDAAGKKIMVPRKNLDVPVALTSWNYLLKLKQIDQAKITEFINTNNDRAPERAPI